MKRFFSKATVISRLLIVNLGKLTKTVTWDLRRWKNVDCTAYIRKPHCLNETFQCSLKPVLVQCVFTCGTLTPSSRAKLPREARESSACKYKKRQKDPLDMTIGSARMDTKRPEETISRLLEWTGKERHKEYSFLENWEWRLLNPNHKNCWSYVLPKVLTPTAYDNCLELELFAKMFIIRNFVWKFEYIIN